MVHLRSEAHSPRQPGSKMALLRVPVGVGRGGYTEAAGSTKPGE